MKLKLSYLIVNVSEECEKAYVATMSKLKIFSHFLFHLRVFLHNKSLY